MFATVLAIALSHSHAVDHAADNPSVAVPVRQSGTVYVVPRRKAVTRSAPSAVHVDNCPECNGGFAPQMNSALAARTATIVDNSGLDPVSTEIVSQQRANAQIPAFYRQPVGHTHTCARGHTWDHTQDGGTHVCPYPGCGLTQTTIDPYPRMVLSSQSGCPPTGWGTRYTAGRR